MARKKVTKKTFVPVLTTIQSRFSASTDKNEQAQWVQVLNKWLDELLEQDFFGTEGQLDPRGDNRE